MVKQDIKQMLHPYLFVLTEGNLGDDMMDYSLMMLSVNSGEVIRSPILLPQGFSRNASWPSQATSYAGAAPKADAPTSTLPVNPHSVT